MLPPKTLAALVVSWKRPHYLKQTLDSLQQFVKYIVVFDNGSDQITKNVIKNHPGVTKYFLAKINRGINFAHEWMLKNTTSKYVLFSDDDMLYTQPLDIGIQFLETHPRIKVFGFHDSPEHHHVKIINGFKIKKAEGGGSLLLLRKTINMLRPLPIYKKISFDWWIFRDGPNHLNRIAVVNTSLHIGCEESTWNEKGKYEYPVKPN